METVAALLAEQSGVISRRQLQAYGFAPHDIQRLLRRKDLAAIRTGVYITHTGNPTWLEQAWAALLVVSGDEVPTDVALAHWSALRVAEGPGRRQWSLQPIHVAIPAERRVRPPRGIVVHRTRHFHTRVHPAAWPQRIRYEEAVLDVAENLSEMDALAVLSRAVGGRFSTAARLHRASVRRPRMQRRRWLAGVLADIDQGSHSVLEHGFVSRVAKPHGIPRPHQQARELTAIGVVYRDAAYRGTLIELDGRLDHTDFERRDADLDRDLFAAATGRATLRLGWGQVFDRPCQTAALLARAVGVDALDCGPACQSSDVWKP